MKRDDKNGAAWAEFLMKEEALRAVAEAKLERALAIIRSTAVYDKGVAERVEVLADDAVAALLSIASMAQLD